MSWSSSFNASIGEASSGTHARSKLPVRCRCSVWSLRTDHSFQGMSGNTTVTSPLLEARAVA